jgi:hypothetical protein
MKLWTQLTKDMELQEIGKKLHVAGDKEKKIKEVMSTLS